MATSGTIGQTRINTAKMLEKATRRCGLSPQILTPEIVDTALESLFMLLMSLSNRGLNLWTIDKQILPIVAGQAKYVLPDGTIDVLNMMFSTQNEVTTGKVVRVGVNFSTLPSATYDLQTSPDNAAWTTVATYTKPDTAGVYDWHDVDPAITATYWRINSDGVTEDVIFSGSNREIPMTPFNRDDYASQPDKTFQSNLSVNYFFEKLVNPQVTLWPVPNDSTRCVVLWRYRQIQDVGDLIDEIELPTRWYEAISWHWAARLAFELPGVEQSRRAEVVQMANAMTIEADGNETDNAPVFFTPGIRCYTR